MTWLDLIWIIPILLCLGFLFWGHIRDEPSFRALWRADRRAEKLLRGVATHAQYQQWCHEQYLDMPSPAVAGIVYRYTPGRMITITLAGEHIADLCIQVAERVPVADIAAAHLLAIRACEADWLATGNLFYPSPFIYTPLIPHRAPEAVRGILALRAQGQTLDGRRRTAHATQPLTGITIGRMREIADQAVRRQLATLAPDPVEEPDPPAEGRRQTLWISLLALGIFIVPITAWALFCATHLALVASWFG